MKENQPKKLTSIGSKQGVSAIHVFFSFNMENRSMMTDSLSHKYQSTFKSFFQLQFHQITFSIMENMPRNDIIPYHLSLSLSLKK